MGNWLTRDQVEELLRVPDRGMLKCKRDYAVLALLIGCALRRRELSVLDIADVQQKEGRWVRSNQARVEPDPGDPDLRSCYFLARRSD